MKTYQIYKEFSRVTCSAAFYIVCDNFIFCTDRNWKTYYGIQMGVVIIPARHLRPIYTVHGWYWTWNPYNNSNPNLLSAREKLTLLITFSTWVTTIKYRKVLSGYVGKKGSARNKGAKKGAREKGNKKGSTTKKRDQKGSCLKNITTNNTKKSGGRKREQDQKGIILGPFRILQYAGYVVWSNFV